ncbi:hypothetical protein C8F01DRAFT_1163339 [Mycena amicta]|nr:hypothetical protein C8F01DRAFT_1163339 [Mycena amicta]
MTPAEQTELEERIQGYIDNLADEGNPTLKAETVQQLRRLLDRVHSADGTVKRWLRAFFPNKVFKSRGTSLHKTLDGIWNEYLVFYFIFCTPFIPFSPNFRNNPRPILRSSLRLHPDRHQLRCTLGPIGTLEHPQATPPSCRVIHPALPSSSQMVPPTPAAPGPRGVSNPDLRHFAPSSIHSFHSSQNPAQADSSRPPSHHSHSSHYSDGSEHAGNPGSYSYQSGSMMQSRHQQPTHRRNMPSLSAFGTEYTDLVPQRPGNTGTMRYRPRVSHDRMESYSSLNDPGWPVDPGSRTVEE